MTFNLKCAAALVLIVASSVGAQSCASQPANEQAALFRAAERGEKDDARKALDHGANVNTPDTSTGRTALHLAAMNGHDEMVRLLLAHGANADAKDNNGETALQLAMSRQHSGTARSLERGSFDKISLG